MVDHTHARSDFGWMRLSREAKARKMVAPGIDWRTSPNIFHNSIVPQQGSLSNAGEDCFYFIFRLRCWAFQKLRDEFVPDHVQWRTHHPSDLYVSLYCAVFVWRRRTNYFTFWLASNNRSRLEMIGLNIVKVTARRDHKFYRSPFYLGTASRNSISPQEHKSPQKVKHVHLRRISYHPNRDHYWKWLFWPVPGTKTLIILFPNIPVCHGTPKQIYTSPMKRTP